MHPAIDIAQHKTAAQAVVRSLEDSGFAVVQGHAVPLEQLEQLYAAWEQFFLSPDRHAYQVDVASQNGYFSSAEAETAKGYGQPDIKEYFQYHPGAELPAPLRDMTEAYFNQLLDLGRTVLGWIEAQTAAALWHSLSAPLSSLLDPQNTLLRLLRYPPLSGNEPADAVRAAAHEDINLITLLPAASQTGLEIKPKGEAWQAVVSPPGTIIINLGDMMQELTQGALPSTTHRVVNPPGPDARLARLTAPVFCHPYGDLRLSARYTADEYLFERLAEINPEALQPNKT